MITVAVATPATLSAVCWYQRIVVFHVFNCNTDEILVLYVSSSSSSVPPEVSKALYTYSNPTGFVTNNVIVLGDTLPNAPHNIASTGVVTSRFPVLFVVGGV